MSKIRNYCLTIFDFNELPALQGDDVKYSAYGDEKCPTTGKEHKQAFICFKNQKTFSAVKKLFPTAHIEAMKGRLEHNEKYCSKEGSYHEFGEKPMTQKDKGEKGKEYWDEQVKLATENPDLCDPKLRITHFNNLERIHQKAKRMREYDQIDTLDNWWFVGESGSGKSSTARKENPGAYIKQCNKWWNGYDYQEVIIIDDVDIKQEFMDHYLNQWADHYPFPAENKGGEMMIRPKRIIITSRYTPDQIWAESRLESIMRRFQIRTFFKNN